MKPSTRTLVAVGVGLAVLNVALAYYNRGRLPGQNKLLDLNDSLAKLNPLALLFPAAASTGAPSTAPTTFAPAGSI